jgi:hypothetical protein
MKFGKGMADKAGRAMKGRTADKMGRAMVKNMAAGGQVPAKRRMGSGSMQPMPKPHEQHFRDQIRTPVIPDPVKYPEYIEEVGEERISGPRMRKGGMAKSKMADKAGRAMKKRSADTMGRAMVKKMAGGGMAYSGGGSVYRKGADGVASKGKTKGKMVKMMMGGVCK